MAKLNVLKSLFIWKENDILKAVMLKVYVKIFRASLVAELVKNLPAMWETWDQSLGLEDPLEKGTATLSSILVWRIPWTV